MEPQCCTSGRIDLPRLAPHASRNPRPITLLVCGTQLLVARRPLDIGRRLRGRRHGSGSTARSRRIVATLAGEASNNPVAKEGERSMLVHQEVVLLIFQLDLDSQLQRALNYERFDAAQAIRERRRQVDEALQQLQESKGSGHQSKADMTDLATEGLRVRFELNKAVEEERYDDAAKLRDRLKIIDAQSASARALAAEWAGMDGASVRLRLGQRVVHAVHGYRGVVAGWDEVCCESGEWQEAAGVTSLAKGGNQTFYHILVDARDWDYDPDMPPVAYVAEELLQAPEEPSTWVEEYGPAPLEHPYSYILFLGQDAAGDLLPVRQLRDKYSVARRDVYAPGQDGSEGDEGDGEGGTGSGSGGSDLDGSGV